MQCLRFDFLKKSEILSWSWAGTGGSVPQPHPAVPQPHPKPHPEPGRVLNLTSKMNFLGQVYHVKWFSGQKLSTCGELQYAASRAEPINHAEPVPGPD